MQEKNAFPKRDRSLSLAPVATQKLIVRKPVAKLCRAGLHALASSGAKSRTSNPAFGSTATDTPPKIRSLSGTCEALRNCTTGKTTLPHFRSAHAERRDERSSVTPVSSALITTGRPSRVPVNRPAKISLGDYLCRACGFSSYRAGSIRHARLTGRCRWEF